MTDHLQPPDWSDRPAWEARRARARKFEEQLSDAIGGIFTRGLPDLDLSLPSDQAAIVATFRRLADDVERFDPGLDEDWYP